MLTKRQNFLETIKGGNPDRFVKQYEFIQSITGLPMQKHHPRVERGKMVQNAWGVWIQFPENVPGPFPVHDEEHKVVKDITKWRDVVKAPNVVFPAEEWAEAIENAESIDRNEVYASIMMAPGIFDQLHYLMGVDDALLNLYIEPEATKELIEYIADYEIAYAAELIKYLKPDLLFHHDDWGSQISSFMSPEMFEEFFVPAYKRVYGFHKANGVEIIVHHSDSYAANLVPSMIDIGIDVFQGCLTTNNVPELVKKYGKQISFMGDINSGVVDMENWTQELIRKEVERACRTNGKLYFIPCGTIGGPYSTYPGVYEAISEEIDRMTIEMF